MPNRYKLIITNRNIYKEVSLSEDMTECRIGTVSECNVRLRKELFFDQFELTFVKVGEIWNVSCSDNLYFTLGDVRKIFTKQLLHGDELYVKYQSSDNEVLRFSFVIDFDYEAKDYNRVVEIGSKSTVKIGGTSDCDICISDEYLKSDCFFIHQKNGVVTVADAGTTYGLYVNGTKIAGEQVLHDCDFFSVVSYSFYYKQGSLYMTSRENVIINGLMSKIVRESETHFLYPKFNRNTRVQYVIPEEKIEIQQPSQMPKKTRKNIVMSLIPSIVMLAMTIVLRGIIGGGGTFVIYSAISMSMGIVMSIVSFVQESKTYKQDVAEREQKYNAYIEEKRAVIEQSRAEELRIRNMIYESIEHSIEEVNLFGRRLFERAKGDPDFLQVYLGKGKIESSNPISYNKQDSIELEDPLELLPEKVAEEYRYLEQAPIVSDFLDSCGVGVVGSKEKLKQLLRNITLDIAIRSFYDEVKMVYILDETYIQDFSWIKWLHNVENEELDVQNIVCDEESKNLLLEYIYSVLSEREALQTQNSEKSIDCRYVVFVSDVSVLAHHPIANYIKKCADYGFTFVFFEEYEENLPLGCAEIIRLEEGNTGSIIKTQNGEAALNFTYPLIPVQTACDVAIKLGAVEVDKVTLEGELTKNISMFELLDIFTIDDLDLSKRWSTSTVYKSLAAPLGVKSKNQVVYLDISDKANAHGPHGLVAGTTGSGKSEVLQTYILAMASLYHPYEVGFVIIDFKGGGMAYQFKNLPHLIGTITNIDGREIDRSLLSIKAELIKRQEIFSTCGVNHIDDYIKLFKEKKVDKPLPHLIMIVDEFAELKAEYPDFMKELISAARIGRTLGVHLILATQKPAGVVDAQIWSNSKFKLCLKVQTKEDSNEVIKTPLAAEIVEPGRAYFQVGNNEIFDLFQSAYSGEKVPEGNSNTDVLFDIYERNLWGKKTLRFTNKKKKAGTSSVTQLQAIVDHVVDYCVSNGIDRLPGICLPSLEDRIQASELVYDIRKDEVSISVPLGIYDDPEQQQQGQVLVELSKDNVYIVGSSQSGKTVMLQTMIYGLIRKYTPKQINLYLIDCGSMVLKIFEDSKHVGGVVLASEEEKCKNLFKLLNTTVIQRKKILSDKGVGNYAAYLDAGYQDLPMMVVVIDNMAAFKEYFPNQSDEIGTLAREAQGVGISFVITAAASNAMNYRIQANFGKKFALNCNDSGEYNTIFGRSKMTPKENPGRGLVMLDKRVLEYQTAIVGKSKKEAERSQEIKEFIEERNAVCVDKALMIPMIPEHLVLADAMQNNVALFRNRGVLPVGMDFNTIEYTNVNFNASSSLVLLGEADAKAAYINGMLTMFMRNVVFHGIEAVVIDDKSRRLEQTSLYGFVKDYTVDTAEAMGYVTDFCMDAVRKIEEEESFDTYTLLVLNSNEVYKRICADKEMCKNLAEVVRRGQTAGYFVVFANVENQAVGFNAPELLKVLKEERKGVLFAPITENKFYEVSGRVKADAVFDETMGYYFKGNSVSRIKLFE